MTKQIETIETKLATARTELADAQRKLTSASALEMDLAAQRQPLIGAARLRGDRTAQAELDRLTRARFEAQQEIEDLRGEIIERIQTEIFDLEREYETSLRAAKIESLRGMMAERGKIGATIQAQVDALSRASPLTSKPPTTRACLQTSLVAEPLDARFARRAVASRLTYAIV